MITDTAGRWVDMDPGEPHAEVEQIGHWTWAVRVIHGIMSWGPNGGPFIVHGSRAHADRIAVRQLTRYRRSEARRATRHEIESPEPPEMRP